MSREGSLEAPTRHAIDWKNPDYIDAEKLDAEMRRQFDVCHGCRRCFNLCDSFPRLFDLVDASPNEMEGVKSEDFKQVVDACTLCDMCFMTKCPYVPPHPFNIDFPHLLLRYRVAERARAGADFFDEQLADTDRNGKLGGLVLGLANWATRRGNGLTRPLMEKLAHVDRNAELPKFAGKTFVQRAKDNPPAVNASAPAHGKRQAVIFATCFANYNNPAIGEAALAVLAKNGVKAEVVYPGCCGMPQLEQGDVARVAEKAIATARALKPHVDAGKDIIALVPSCALMMKFEWPLILPDDPDVKALSQAAFDITEYVVAIADDEGIAPGLEPVPGGIALHFACHSRAQNMGAMGAEMLRLIPDTDVAVIERCSGHGGSWGVKQGNFEIAAKFGKGTAKRAADSGKTVLASECPLAGKHLAQVLEGIEGAGKKESLHPIQILAKAYGL